MNRRTAANWAGIVAALMAIGACTPVKRPLTCQVQLSSGDGGMIDIAKFDPDRNFHDLVRPLSVFWYAPASGPGVHLIVSYGAATLKHIGAPDGGRMQFTPGPGTHAGQFKAIVSTDASHGWTFTADPDFTAAQGNFLFSANDPSGAAVTAAIAEGKTIHVIVLKDGQPVHWETFTTSGAADRDQLLAQARRIIDGADPKYCSLE